MRAIGGPSHSVLDTGTDDNRLTIRQELDGMLHCQPTSGAKSRLLGFHAGEIKRQLACKETMFMKVVPEPAHRTLLRGVTM
jgi:hypothetical protein